MDEKIYKEHAKTIYWFLMSLCHNHTIAEDLMQETFLRAYESIDRYNGSCKLSVWLCQIAKHLWYQYLEKHKHEAGVPLPETDASYDIETQLFAKYDFIKIMKILHTLPEDMREVIYIKLASDLTFREIGEILEKSENWARVTYFRGKEKLMKGLMEYEKDNI